MSPCIQHLALKDNVEICIEAGVDPVMPGIYLWQIEGVNCYVGKYTNANRPLVEYINNIRKICFGLPYRKSKPDQFRRIHHALHEALHQRKKITLLYLENVAVEMLNEREHYWIDRLATTLNG